MRLLMSLSLPLLCLFACRDEQAGPRPKPVRSAPTLRMLDSAPQGLQGAAGATLGEGSIQYLGSRVSLARALPGTQVKVAHYFRALKAPPPGFLFFTHVVDAQSGQQLLNADHPFAGGVPMESWPQGLVVEDVHTFAVPGAPSGKAVILLGFWKGEARLPVDDPSAHGGDQRVRGPVLETLQESLPEYHARKTAAPPRVDGKLNDPVWALAPAVELKGSFDGSPPHLRTVAKLAWDDQNLYVAFDCEDPDVWGTLRAKDDAIYNEEVVEVFIDANGDGRTYNELELSPHGVQFDAAFESYRSDLETAKKWESGMVSAVQVRGTLDNPSDEDQGWTAEMRIPLARLSQVPRLPPQPGDRFRMNLYRLEHLGRKQVEGQSFSPLFRGDFHNLPRFGWLVLE